MPGMREEVKVNEAVLFIQTQNQGVRMWLEIILGIIACEALVQLWFHAAPIQPVRNVLVRITPFLYSRQQDTHLLNCKYCLSVWCGIAVAVLYFCTPVYLYIVIPLSIHRLANFVHIIFSLLRDRQIDLRTGRGK